MQLLMGYRATQAIHVAASLGIPDLLADGPRQSDDLAREAGADPDALYRLLRALAAIGVLEEDDERRFALTPLGEPLRTDVPGSLHGWALLDRSAEYWRSWGNLEHSIRTGENSFRALHGTDVWEWRAEPAGGERDLRRRDAVPDRTRSNRAILDGVRLRRASARSSTSAAATALCSPRSSVPTRHARGVLFDQPHVVDRRRAGPRARRRPRRHRRRQLLRVRAGGRGRVRPQVDRPRLGGRGGDRDPPRLPRRDVAGGEAARDRADPRRRRTKAPTGSSPT